MAAVVEAADAAKSAKTDAQGKAGRGAAKGRDPAIRRPYGGTSKSRMPRTGW